MELNPSRIDAPMDSERVVSDDSPVTAMLWDLRAQLEAQLRRLAQAQGYWLAAQNDTAQLARAVVLTNEMLGENLVFCAGALKLRDELVRLASPIT